MAGLQAGMYPVSRMVCARGKTQDMLSTHEAARLAAACNMAKAGRARLRGPWQREEDERDFGEGGGRVLRDQRRF